MIGRDFAGAHARARRLYLVSPLAGDAHHVSEAEWRREGDRRLGG